jgi:Cu-processing system ATP-binding protein
MIRVENISKRFKKLQALDQVSARLDSGKVISLIGPNGSGKTTLIKCILGMVKPAKGKIYVNEMKINGDPSYRKQIGYMPQIGRYPDNMKVGQLFAMMKHIRNASENDLDTDLITKFNLVSIFDKPMRTLSGGTRQKVSAALAFYFNPGILILDEPTAGLDPLSSEILKEKIIAEKRRNKLILITSHILSDLDDLATDIMYLQEGKLQFVKSIETLRKETGEPKLGKAIAKIMRHQLQPGSWVDEVLNIKPEDEDQRI